MKKATLKKVARIVIPIIIIAGAGIAAYYYFQTYHEPEDPDLLRTSGIIEAVEVKVSTKIGGIISKLLVEEGDEVRAGQVLAGIDTVDLELQLDEAKAAVSQAEALLRDVRKGLRKEEIDKLEKIARLKKANLERAQLDYDKKKSLADKEALPKHQADMALKLVEAAQEDYESALDQVAIAKKGSREDQISAAEFSLKRSKARVAQLEQRIADSTVTSPISGRISIKNMEQGEFARPGSVIVTLVDLNKPWVRVFVPENKLGRVKLGMEAEIISDTFPDTRYEGIIRHIATEAEFTPKNVQTQEERVKLVFAVKIFVDNPNQELKPGMPVDALIDLD